MDYYKFDNFGDMIFPEFDHDDFCDFIGNWLEDNGWVEVDCNARVDLFYKRITKEIEENYILIEMKILDEDRGPSREFNTGIGQIIKYLGQLDVPIELVYTYLVYFDRIADRSPLDINTKAYSGGLSKFLLPIDIIPFQLFGNTILEEYEDVEP